MTFGRVLFGLCALLLVGAAGAYASGVRLNVTHSMPVGLYQQVPAALARGELVVACPGDASPVARLAIERGYFPVGDCAGGVAPLLKPIAAVAGDRVRVTNAGVWINGVMVPDSRPLPYDGRRRALPRQRSADYIVPDHHVLLLVPGTRSFDGRYLGPLPVNQVRAAARPVLTL